MPIPASDESSTRSGTPRRCATTATIDARRTTASSQPGDSRNANGVPSKSMPTSARRERAGRERGQERADARRAGQAGALEDVDEKSHSVR